MIPLLALLALLPAALAQTTRPLRCEDPIAGQTPYAFNSGTLSCVISVCGQPNIPGSSSYDPNIAPLAINTTAIPYCVTKCLRPDASAQQLALAPSCWDYCQHSNGATPEQLGWCQWWCVAGQKDRIVSTTCEPEYSYQTKTTLVGSSTLVYPALVPASWYNPFSTTSSRGAMTTAVRTTSSRGAVTTAVQTTSRSGVVTTAVRTTVSGGYYDADGVYHGSGTVGATSRVCDYNVGSACVGSASSTSVSATATASTGSRQRLFPEQTTTALGAAASAAAAAAVRKEAAAPALYAAGGFLGVLMCL